MRNVLFAIAGSLAACHGGDTTTTDAILQTRSDPVLDQVPCTVPPPIDGSKNFIQNFLNSCYAIPLSSGSGGTTWGNADAIYYELGYLGIDPSTKLPPSYEIVLYSPGFANARYSSIEINDSHLTLSPNLELHDEDIVPLTPGAANPFKIGAHFVPNTPYAARITLGTPLTTTLTDGCDSGSGSNAITLDSANVIDASHIHKNVPADLSWNTDHAGDVLPRHKDNAPNGGGMIYVRDYDYLTHPPIYAFVRDTSTGCAVLAADALQRGLVSTTKALGVDTTQIAAHECYANQLQPLVCYSADQGNLIPSFRGASYLPGPNIDAAYGGPSLTPALIQGARANGQLIEIKFKMPTFPATPCADGNCTRTGTEQIRDRVISVMNGNITLGSLNDSDFLLDADRNADLLINVTPGLVPAYSGPPYTYFDATAVLGFTTVTGISVRDVLPSASFGCSFFSVPNRHAEVGTMGQYGLVTSLVKASAVPRTPTPDHRAATCGQLPPASIPCPPTPITCP